MITMADRNLAYINEKLEAAMESLRTVTAEGLDMAVYAKVMDARMDISGAVGALISLRRDLEARRS